MNRMELIDEFMQKKKTILVCTLGIFAIIAYSSDIIDREQFEVITATLGFTGLFTHKLGINRVEEKIEYLKE